MDNRCYDEMRDIISLPRSYSRSDLNTSSLDQINTLRHIKLLQDQFVKCQSDIVVLKEEKIRLKRVFDDEIKSVRSDILKVSKEIGDQLHSIVTDLQRINDEKSSGVTSLKNAMKLSNNEINLCKDASENGLSELRNKILNTNKKLDRQCGKIETKLSEVNNYVKINCCSTSARIPVNACNGDNSKTSTENSDSNTISYRDALTGGSVNSDSKCGSQSTRQNVDHSIVVSDVPLHHVDNDKNGNHSMSQRGLQLEDRNTPNNDYRGLNNNASHVQTVNKKVIDHGEPGFQNQIQVRISRGHNHHEETRTSTGCNTDQSASAVATTDGDEECDFSEYVVKKTKRSL